MKKILFSVLMLAFLTSFSYGACSTCGNKDNSCGCKKAPVVNRCDNNCEKSCDKTYETPCDKSKYEMIDDDEYCTYNQCYFNKVYRNMKNQLCLSSKQECQIDALYKEFKNDMENIHSRFRAEKNKTLEMIACNNDCWKDQKKAMKQTGKDAKERCKEFKKDVKEQLCKNQYSAFRKYERQEKRKMKKLVKYGKIVKLPCVDCCK